MLQAAIFVVGKSLPSQFGYQAINLAIQLGAKRVVLLGYDMKLADDGKRHWFGDHPQQVAAHSQYQTFIDCFKGMADVLSKTQIWIYNCTPDSALTCFIKKDLRDLADDL